MGARVSLVTGGHGFIGAHLCRALVDRGDRVHVLGRSRDAWRLRGLERQLKLHRADVTRLADVRRAVQRARPDVVFHLAALTNVAREPALFDAMVRTNVGGTENVLRACEGRVRRLVHVGTCEEYGTLTAPFRESDRERPVSPYSWSKTAATHLCQMWHRTRGVPVVVVRPFLTFGPMQTSDMFVPALIRACLRGRPFPMTAGRQTREFNYVGDIVRGLMAAATARGVEGEVINLGGGPEIRLRDAARTIERACGGAPVARLGALPYRAGEVTRFYAATAKEKKILKVAPRTSFEDGVRETVAWYRRRLAEGRTA